MDREERSYRRLLIVIGLVFYASLFLFVQLIRIQIVEQHRFTELAIGQRARPLLTNQLRGGFYDRNGYSLRGPETAWYLLIKRPLSPSAARRVAAIVGADFLAENERQRQAGHWVYSQPLRPAPLRQLRQLKLDSLQVVANSANPVSSRLAWHLLGSVRDGHGVSGLEYLYDSFLRRSQGASSLVAFSDGLRQSFQGLGIRNRQNIDGSGVILTLDRRIQTIVESTLDQERFKGAVVILDVDSGQILAMASRPMINIVAPQASLEDPDKPFLNRAIAAYNPGSVFKLVVLSSGLDRGLLKPDESFTNYHSYRIDDRQWLYPSTYGVDHGRISLTDALAGSCNPVFIEIALRLQPGVILDCADKLGLGQPCNIGLKDEAWGNLPSGVGMSPVEQANMALGQQDVLMTPLQVAAVVQTIANDGVRNMPRLVLGTRERDNSEIKWLEPEPPVRVLKPETARIVQRMMKAVVDSGTGQEAAIAAGAAGKTGTAQTGAAGSAVDNAWFAGFAPYRKPRFAVAVFCEQGGAGGKTAAPIFREIMEKVTKIRD